MAKPPPPLERSVQRGVLKMMGICFPQVFVFHVPNGAFLAGNETERKRQMGILLGDGLKPGMTDLVCVWNHAVAFMEVKRRGGKLSPEQEKVHAILADMGYQPAIVTDSTQAFDYLRERGAPCRVQSWREAA